MGAICATSAPSLEGEFESPAIPFTEMMSSPEKTATATTQNGRTTYALFVPNRKQLIVWWNGSGFKNIPMLIGTSTGISIEHMIKNRAF